MRKPVEFQLSKRIATLEEEIGKLKAPKISKSEEFFAEQIGRLAAETTQLKKQVDELKDAVATLTQKIESILESLNEEKPKTKKLKK